MKGHTGKEHSVPGVRGMKCKSSGSMFQLKSDMEKHMMIGRNNSAREDILKRHTELLKKITLQKINLVNSLYKLRQTEDKKKETCSCKGFCRILHSRFRWKPSQSEYLYQKFEAIHESSSRVKCKICDFQFNDEEIFKTHVKTTHPSSAKYKCEQCDETVSKENKIGKHMECVHALENFNCQECGNTFQSEERLKVHVKRVHKTHPLNSTFFNPSANH